MFNKKKKDEEIIVKSKPTDEEINASEILNDETSESLPETEQVEEKKEKKSLFKIKKKNSNETEKSEKEENQQTQKVIKWGPNRVLQCFAYFAVILIAIVMILRLIFKDNANPEIVEYMQGISEVLAYLVCIWLGFYFTRKRGNIWWLVGWIVASIILVIFYIFAVV
mgnify:FL=1